MVRTFGNKATAAIFAGRRVKTLPPDLWKRMREKLDLIDQADSLSDLRQTPSNRLEPLTGKRRDQWSIRINRRWRVCFRWDSGDAFAVEITDYH